MTYTSEQYKYLLLKRLQRHFSLPNLEDRNYTYTFFGKLMDESVTITEESYNNFVRVMDDELAYCAENGIVWCGDIDTSDVDDHALVLVDAFAAIGIALSISKEQDENGYYNATFVKPNGEVMVYGVDANLMGTRNRFYINARAGTEYNYAKLSAPYYNMQHMEVLELSDCNINVCGVGCYWKYDAGTQTMTITGDGTYYLAPTYTDIGSGKYTTLIIGANVTRLAANCLSNSSISTIVLLHAADFPLLMDAVVDTKTTVLWDVYADNEAFRNYAWSSSAAITWHSLDEWEG